MYGKLALYHWATLLQLPNEGKEVNVFQMFHFFWHMLPEHMSKMFIFESSRGLK